MCGEGGWLAWSATCRIQDLGSGIRVWDIQDLESGKSYAGLSSEIGDRRSEMSDLRSEICFA